MKNEILPFDGRFERRLVAQIGFNDLNVTVCPRPIEVFLLPADQAVVDCYSSAFFYEFVDYVRADEPSSACYKYRCPG